MTTGDRAGPARASGHEHRAWIGLGANLGDAPAQLRQALRLLDEVPGCALIAASSLWQTRPVDAPGPDYTNAVAHLATSLTPDDLLGEILRIENRLGRVRSFRNAPRTLDLDLLLYDTLRIDTPVLVLPHPRMHQRAFVLAPLAELQPALELPGLGRVADLLAGLPDQPITKIPDSP